MNIPKTYINEIFTSIQGEGLLTGCLTMFVRFQGCHVGCKWCDTKVSWKQKKEHAWKSVELLKYIKDEIKKYPEIWVCITGGEPLEQLDQLKWIVEKLYKNNIVRLSIETAGVPVPDRIDVIDMMNNNLFFSVSPKLHSALGRRFNEETLFETIKFWDESVYINHKLQLKFVVSTDEDFHSLYNIFSQYQTEHPLFIQVESSKLNDPYFISKCYNFVRDFERFRLNIQQHVILNLK